MVAVKSKTKQLSFDDLALLYKRFLRVIAIMPFEGRDYTLLGTRILFAYFFASSLLHCNMFIFYLISARKVPSIDNLFTAVLVFGFNARYYLLLLHRVEFNALMEECQHIYEVCDNEGRILIRFFEQKMRKLFQFLLGTCVCLNIMYSLSAISLTLTAAHINGSDPRVLPYTWFSEDAVNLWPGYEITFALQVLVIHNAGIISSTVDSAAPLLIMLGAGYFRALQSRLLRTSDDEDNPQRAYLELIACSRLHQRILNFCLRIEKLTRTLFFVQLLCSGYNTSLIGIKLIGSDPDKYKYTSVALLNVSQLFICQWASDYLLDESEAVSKAAFYVSLTWMKSRIGKILVLIIARAQRPVQMTAGGLINLSLENFGSMLTSAVSFFTVLRNSNF